MPRRGGLDPGSLIPLPARNGIPAPSPLPQAPRCAVLLRRRLAAPFHSDLQNRLRGDAILRFLGSSPLSTVTFPA